MSERICRVLTCPVKVPVLRREIIGDGESGGKPAYLSLPEKWPLNGVYVRVPVIFLTYFNGSRRDLLSADCSISEGMVVVVM